MSPGTQVNGLSPFVKWVLAVVTTLTVVAIVGTVRQAISQGKQDTKQNAKIEHIEKEVAARDSAVRAIPVIQEQIQQINDDVD